MSRLSRVRSQGCDPVTPPVRGSQVTSHTPCDHADQVAAIAAATGLSEETVALVRWTAEHAWQPATVEDYMQDQWPFERPDLADPGVRL